MTTKQIKDFFKNELNIFFAENGFQPKPAPQHVFSYTAKNDHCSYEASGNIGLFAGLKNILVPQVAGSFTPLNIKLMRPAELLFAIENDYEGRLKLAALYKQQGDATVSRKMR